MTPPDEALSAMVSTNRVYRLVLADGDQAIAKSSNYGSFFMFAEDHERLHLATELLAGGPYENFMAHILTRDGQTFFFVDLDSVALGRCFTDRPPRLRNHVQLYDSFRDRLDDRFLEPFLARMLPSTLTLADWMKRVRRLQSKRRARRSPERLR